MNTIDMGIAIIHHNPEMFSVVEIQPPMFDKSHPIFKLELQSKFFSEKKTITNLKENFSI